MGENLRAHTENGNARSLELVATRMLGDETSESALDPRVEEISWIAFRASAARLAAIKSTADLSEALRGTADVLERTWDPGRTATLTRLSATPDGTGGSALDLSLAVGVLGARGETSAEMDAISNVVETAMGRYPAPFAVEQIDAETLLDRPIPRHLAAIRQRWVEAADDAESVRAVSRFDRQLESWLELADLLTGCGTAIVLQSTFFATTLSPADVLWLEQEAERAEEMATRAVSDKSPVLARRAARLRETLVDLAESFSGPLWVGEVTVGADQPLARPLLRSIAGSITNELDVIHARQASPVVADRHRIVGGFEIEVPPCAAWDRRDASALAWSLGLPSPVFSGSTLRDYYSLTEAGLCFRWPIAAGRAVRGLAVHGSSRIPAPPGLPSEGLRLGRDPTGRDVFLGGAGVRSHVWAVGATGAGKSTYIRLCARHDLEAGRGFVLIDAHGDLSRAVRADAAEQGREVVLVDADEDETLAFDVLGGADALRDSEERARAIARLIDALTSHLPADWVGPRFRQLARASLELLVSAASRQRVGLADIGRLLYDEAFLEGILLESDEERASQVLRQHVRESDRASVGLWVSSKFEDIALNPAGARILAPFGEGVAVRDALAAGIPFVVNLSAGRLSRLASGLLGHVVLASTVDYALSRTAGARSPFTLYVDEAQRFPAVNLVDALAETRKYGCSVVVAHQELSQLEPELRDALISNAAARVLFRTGLADASALALLTGLSAPDFTSLPNLHSYLQLDGAAPFSVELAPPEPVVELPAYRPPTGISARQPGRRQPPSVEPEELAEKPVRRRRARTRAGTVSAARLAQLGIAVDDANDPAS
jgi:DNA helicase HerA-like ATPase